MPVEAQTVEYSYVGDGTTKVFPFPSKFLSGADISVGLDGAVQTAGFSVSGAGDEAGGGVTFASAPAAGMRVTLVRKPPASQLLDFVNGQTILESTLDTGLDKLTMLVQYLLRSAARTVRLADLAYDTAAGAGTVLPTATDRASRILGFDAAGALTTYPAGGIPDAAAGVFSLLSSTAVLGKVYFMPSNTTVGVNVPGDAATVQAALEGIALWVPGNNCSVTITVTQHMAAVSDLGKYTRNDGLAVAITGPAPVALTVTSFDVPTGVKGNRSIGINVASAANVAVGDVIVMRGFPESYADSGSLPAGSAPVHGAFNHAYRAGSGNCQITIVAGTNTATFTQAVSTVECPVGSLLFVQGQMRTVTARPTTTTATVSSNWRISLTSNVYWSILASEAGTVAVTGGTLTATGGALLSCASPGDLICIADADFIGAIQSITDNTTAVLENNVTFAAGKGYAVIRRCWEHEAAFEVTAVAGNKVTVKNTSWGEYNLPYTALVPGSCVALKASLSVSAGGTSGLKVRAGGLSINNLAIKGSGSTGIGVDASGDSGGGGTLVLGSNFAVIGFYYGLKAQGAMFVYAKGATFAAASFASFYITNGANAFLDSARCFGAGTYGLLQDGGHIYGSRLRTHCNGEDGKRIEVGGSFYGDWCDCSSNGGRGDQDIGAVAFHFVGSRFMLNGGNVSPGGGLNLQNGPSGRGTGIVAFRNRGWGFLITRSSAELSYAVAMGNYSGGWSVDGASNIDAERSGAVFNFDVGYDIRGGSARLRFAQAWGNYGGFILYEQAKASFLYAYASNNVYGPYKDVNVSGGAHAYVYGILGAPVYNQAINRMLNAASLISDDGLVTF